MDMKLTNPTDAELNIAFAEHVCGWLEGGFIGSSGKYWVNADSSYASDDLLRFTESADAVLPWLEKRLSWSRDSDGTVWVELHTQPATFYGCEFDDLPFPKAAVIALLRAHGVKVELTVL
jgi:hypothetical protein